MKAIHQKCSEAEAIVLPNAITLKTLLSGADTNGQQAIFEDLVEPGIEPGLHMQHHQDEIFFF